jgi:hypothetical protein
MRDEVKFRRGPRGSGGRPHERSRLTVPIFGLLLLVGSTSAGEARAEDPSPAALGVFPITSALCEDMKAHHVIKPDAPVGCERLRLVKFRYVDFSGRSHDDGEIVVIDAAAKHVVTIFAKLRAMHFPIERARLMNRYDGNDDASMADNNTSAFNLREISGGGPISLHGYGLAIDINPIQNPYAKRAAENLTFNPPAGIAYANRLNDRPAKPRRFGMAEQVIDVFADNGFVIWGGYWDDPIDYQHFQVGRSLAEQLAHLAPAQAQAEFDRHVEKYRACRRTSSRTKCIVAAEPTGNHAGD